MTFTMLIHSGLNFFFSSKKTIRSCFSDREKPPLNSVSGPGSTMVGRKSNSALSNCWKRSVGTTTWMVSSSIGYGPRLIFDVVRMETTVHNENEIS